MSTPIQRQLEIFNAALERPAGPERDAYLAEACAGDEALRQCVEDLLSGHSRAGTFLVTAAGPVGPTGTRLLPVTERPGDKIDRYKLLQQIGEGGCGTVYMAEQEEPVRRRVALKVIRLGMDTKSVIARFEAERQALALMDHPNIAKVFDGGATESGRPYFVMELVRGIKITEYCDQAHLSTEERLKLFIQVCQAVQHAHQKGVIHRDIKPSNILVTVNDGVAVPKVIDFGIAKATDQRLTDKTYFTEFHAFIGTPAYTSPEQAEMSSLDIDTRSDIYSLGVLLYEMLTGQTPFPAERLLQSGLDEMRRIIREEEPPRPSTRLTTLPLADASELSRKRQLKIPALANAVEGDIDWIVMKALEKDRSRRYATSLDFAADLQRHLNNEAVLARPPSIAYKFQRAIRRNKGAFAAAAAVFTALLMGLGLTAWQAVRAKNAEQAARSAALAAKAHAEKARADRDRAVMAESNATENANSATNALQTANERMVKLNVAEGWRRVEEGDHFGALLPFAEAFALEQDKLDRAEIHQMRLASVLQRSPKLVNVWSVGTNINHAEFSRDGSKLIASWNLLSSWPVKNAAIYETTTGRLLIAPADTAKKTYAHFIAWSGDEKRFITQSHLRDRVQGDDGQPTWATRAWFRDVQTWDAATGQTISPAIHSDEHVTSAGAMLNYDGKLFLVFQTETNQVSLRDAATGKILWKQSLSQARPLESPHPALFSPDGRVLVCGEGILDVRSGQNLETNADYRFAEFSADSSRLFVAGGNRGSLCDWAKLRVGTVPFATVTDWRRGVVPYLGKFSRDGKKLATANGDSTVRIWNTADGSPLTSPIEHSGLVSDVCFSHDGTWLATGMGKWVEEGYAQVWDAATGKALTPRLPHDGRVLRVAFNEEKTRLFVAGESGNIAVWSLTGFNVPRFTWSAHKLDEYPYAGRFRLSSDGKCFIAESGLSVVRGEEDVSQLGNVRCAFAWNLASGDMPLPPWYRGLQSMFIRTNQVIDPDFEKWSVSDWQDISRVTDDMLKDIVGTAWEVRGVSPDDAWILAAHTNGSPWRFISATNRTIQSPYLTHRGNINFGDFTPDNRIAMTVGSDSMLRSWTVPGAESLALPLTLSPEAREVWATTDGRGFVTVHHDDTLRFWELSKGKRPVSEWLALARFFAKGRGTGLGGTGDSPVPPRPSFRDEWLALRAKHPEVFTVFVDEVDAWHRHEAWRCESRKDWSNAAHHLTELLKTQPDSGDFLPRRAAACVAMANDLVAFGVSRITSQTDATQQENQIRLTPDATNLLERALADYNRTLAWVDRYPAIAKESRKPFVEKRRELYLKLGRNAEADADERELKSAARN